METKNIVGGALYWAVIIITIAILFATMGMIGILVGVIIIVAGLSDLFLTHAHYQTYGRDLPEELMKKYREEIVSPFKQRGVIGAITVLAGILGVGLSIMVMI